MPSLSAIPASHTSVGRYRPSGIVTASGPSSGSVWSSTRHPPSARTDEAEATTSTLRACCSRSSATRS
jgi:hypothetical protein